MTCEHPGCSLTVFSACTNHCRKGVCLEHLIEHGDQFLHDFTSLVDQLDKSTANLFEEASNASTQIAERRQHEIARLNRIYEEEQQTIRKQLAFAEAANALVIEKQNQLANCRSSKECHLALHDLEQLKAYAIQMKNSLVKKQAKPITPRKAISGEPKSYTCPLTQPDVFGITLKHNIRWECDGAAHLKYNLAKHFEYYHRMLPDCANRLRNAIVDDRLPPETQLFSEDEVILNLEYRVDCPLTDPTNIYGAQTTVSALVHIPCTKKQIAHPSMINHFHLYHKMKYDVAKRIVEAMKAKSLCADLVLFGKNERLASSATRS